jgi:hypothetical protein
MPPKINYNKLQKEKQLKILRYYRKSLKSALPLPKYESTKSFKRTKKQMQGSGLPDKLTKVNTDKLEESEVKDNKKIIEKLEQSKLQEANKQFVIMD